MSAEGAPDSVSLTAEQIARWSTAYGVGRRTLFRWNAAAVERGKPCPFDEPAKMPEWWQATHKQRVPAEILHAALAAARMVQSATPPPAPAESSAAIESPSPPRRDEGYNLPAQVDRLRDEQQRIQRQLDQARAGVLVGEVTVTNQSDCESLLRQSLAITPELRKSEAALLEWQTAREELVPAIAVRSENVRVCGSIYAAMLRLLSVVRPLLHQKTDAEQDAIWRERVRACFESIKDAKFTDYAAALGEP